MKAEGVEFISAICPEPNGLSGRDLADTLGGEFSMQAAQDLWQAQNQLDLLEIVRLESAGIARALGDIARAKGMSQVAKALGVRLHAPAAPPAPRSRSRSQAACTSAMP